MSANRREWTVEVVEPYLGWSELGLLDVSPSSDQPKRGSTTLIVHSRLFRAHSRLFRAHWCWHIFIYTRAYHSPK